jgi:hypothetical protein
VDVPIPPESWRSGRSCRVFRLIALRGGARLVREAEARPAGVHDRRGPAGLSSPR